jgi:hypothetical protein
MISFLCLSCVSSLFRTFIDFEWKINDTNSSDNLRTNNIFCHLGMPGSLPIPILCEMYNVMRQLSSFTILFADINDKGC